MPRDSTAPRQKGALPTRRDFMRASGRGALAAGLAGALPTGPASASQQPARSRPSSFGRTKSVVVLFLYGAPSQIDTLDPKPHAPEGVRGEFKPIRTSLPGVLV